jgi:hypothetical protein
VGTSNIPPFALSVRCQNERALPRADEYPYAAHLPILLYARVPRT